MKVRFWIQPVIYPNYVKIVTKRSTVFHSGGCIEQLFKYVDINYRLFWGF